MIQKIILWPKGGLPLYRVVSSLLSFPHTHKNASIDLLIKGVTRLNSNGGLWTFRTDWEWETGGARFFFLFKIEQKMKFSPSNHIQFYGFQTGPQISTNLYFHQTEAQYSAMRAAHPTLTYNTNLCIRGRILHLEPGVAPLAHGGTGKRTQLISYWFVWFQKAKRNQEK